LVRAAGLVFGHGLISELANVRTRLPAGRFADGRLELLPIKAISQILERNQRHKLTTKPAAPTKDYDFPKPAK